MYNILVFFLKGFIPLLVFQNVITGKIKATYVVPEFELAR